MSSARCRRPTRFYLTANLKTAKALGIEVPRSIMLRADTTCPAAVLSDHTELEPRVRLSFLTTRDHV